MQTRRFEFADEKSSKFWEVARDASSVTARWGKIGTDGQTKTKDHGSEEAAQAALEKQIAQKRKKGYLEVSGGPSPSDDPPRQRKLRQLAGMFDAHPGPKVKVQLLMVDHDADRPIESSWVGGPASVHHWPRYADYATLLAAPRAGAISPDGAAPIEDLGEVDTRMAHLLTLDASKIEVAGVPEGSKAISMFTPSTSWCFVENFVELVTVPQSHTAPTEEGPADLTHGTERLGRTLTAKRCEILPAVEVPAVVFMRGITDEFDYDEYLDEYEAEGDELEDMREGGEDEEARTAFLNEDSELRILNQWNGKRRKLGRAEYQAIDDLLSLLGQSPYIGGAPIWLQSHNHEDDQQLDVLEQSWFDRFYLQFGEELCPINLGDSGVAYVTLDSSQWECG